MPQPINLNKARKAKAKAAKMVESAQNRAKFGQTKGEKTAQTLRQQKAGSALDGHKLKSEVGPDIKPPSQT